MIKIILVAGALAVGQLVAGQSSRPAKEDVAPMKPQDQGPRVASTSSLAMSGMETSPAGVNNMRKPQPGVTGEDIEESTGRPMRRRPQNRRPRPQYYEDYMEEDEDCEDDARDYMPDYSGMMRIATDPMRHFGRMMGDIFQRMPDFRGDKGGPPGSVMASSSAFVGGGGGDDDQDYSRVSSQVRTPDGRLRGIVSETRNGRTQTRRIGNDQDSDSD